MDSIKEIAFDWSTDYKPWEDNLSPQEYAAYGFEQGYKRAIRDYLENVLPKETVDQILEECFKR